MAPSDQEYDVLGEVLGFKNCGSTIPHAEMVLISIVSAHNSATNNPALRSLGFAMVAMSQHPINCNRIVKDLRIGSDQFEMPRCGKGSLVWFRGCTLDTCGILCFTSDKELPGDLRYIVLQASSLEVRQVAGVDEGSA